MMDKFILEERLERINKRQLKDLTEYLFKISTKTEKIDFNSLPREYSGLLRHFSKLSADEKRTFLEYIKEYVQEHYKNSLSDVSAVLNKSSNIIENKALEEAPKRLNKDDIFKRMDKLSLEDKEALANYFRLLATNGQFEMTNVDRKILGILKLFIRLNTEDKVKLLEIVREKLIKEALENGNVEELIFSLSSSISELRMKKIYDILNKAHNLDIKCQEIFVERASKEITEIYKSVAKEYKTNNCNHNFSEWKDCSYTRDEDSMIDWQRVRMPVEHIRFERKCKKCSYVEVVDYIPREVAKNKEVTAKKNKIKQLRRELNKVEKELEVTTKEIATMNRETLSF